MSRLLASLGIEGDEAFDARAQALQAFLLDLRKGVRNSWRGTPQFSTSDPRYFGHGTGARLGLPPSCLRSPERTGLPRLKGV